MKSILVTGLCTLHWGRLQYGNIGNYYIVEPLFRQLHKHFPDYKIVTTFQMDEQFIRKEDIEVVPRDIIFIMHGMKMMSLMPIRMWKWQKNELII